MTSIAVAEGRQGVREQVHQALEVQGYDVIDITDAADLAARLPRLGADVLLLDVDWLDANDALLPPRAEHPVVLIVHDEDDARTEAAMERGVHDYIAEPIRPRSLLARVESALRVRELRRQLDEADQLTGLLSPEAMRRALGQWAAGAQRYGYNVSIVLMDVDRLAKVNERWDSTVGDEVLRSVARHIAADVRTSDLAGRWDGDEFLLVLPHTPVNGAVVLADRLRLTLAEMPVRLPDGSSVAVTASFGCAQGTHPTILLDAAAGHLGKAKRAGRNAVAW